jgi:hypothetical protein
MGFFALVAGLSADSLFLSAFLKSFTNFLASLPADFWMAFFDFFDGALDSLTLASTEVAIESARDFFGFHSS